MQPEATLDDNSDDEDLVEIVGLLAKNVNRVMKKINKQLKGNYCLPKNISQTSNPFNNLEKFGRFKMINTESRTKSRGIQCRECDGFGHIQAEYANKKKKNKSFTMSWSGDETEETGRIKHLK